MIKIELSNISSMQSDYYKLVSPLVLSRLQNLKTALEHFNAPSRISLPIKDFRQIKTISRKLIQLCLNKKIPEIRFSKANYSRTMIYYASRAKRAGVVNHKYIYGLIELLTDPMSMQLRELLTCEAAFLSKTNLKLEKSYSISGSAERKAISLAFDYEVYAEISNVIRGYFRRLNLVNYCPYCNQDPAMYSGLRSGKTVRVHQLDHFFDKASHPLLCYSLFNLVPGDWNCNSINKRSIPFSSDLHLNPYVDGFGKTMCFEPNYDQIGSSMLEINLTIDKSAPKDHQKQLLGSRFLIDENEIEGNINVFALQSKYNYPEVKLEAAKVHRKFLNNVNNITTLKNFINALPVHSAYDLYKYWYEEEIRTPFESKDFNRQRYSKLFRDLHDFILSKDSQFHNDKIRDIIVKYP